MLNSCGTCRKLLAISAKSNESKNRPPLNSKTAKKEEDDNDADDELVKFHDNFISQKGKKLVIHIVGIKSSGKNSKDSNLKEGILTIELKNIPKFFFNSQRNFSYRSFYR